MDISSVCIVGASGFVGRAIAEQLSARGIRVRAITRSRPRAMPLAVLPTVEVVVANPHDTAALARSFENMDAVINLVGILHEHRGQSFRACHAELPRSKPIAVLCHHGMRSQTGALFLEKQGFEGVMSVDGGIEAYALSVDHTIPRY